MIVGVVVTVIAVCRFADGSFGTSTPPLDHDNHELMHANASSSLFPNPFASPLLFESKHNLRFLVNQLERNQLGRVGSNNGSAGKSNTHPVTASEEDRQRTSGESEAPDYRRVGPDDDEIHDEEILKAVQRSLYEFYFNKMVRGGGVDDPTTGNSSEVRSRGKNDPHHRTRRGIKMVCYGVLGCFRDEGVFDYLDMVPASPDEINTRFFVYTRTVNAQHAPEVSAKTCRSVAVVLVVPTKCFVPAGVRLGQLHEHERECVQRVPRHQDHRARVREHLQPDVGQRDETGHARRGESTLSLSNYRLGCKVWLLP